VPYIKKEERTYRLNLVSDHLFKMFLEFYETGNAKYLNYVISRAALKAVNVNPKYEQWRKTKSVLQDVVDEFKHRMCEYETNARQINGDLT